MKKTRSFWDVTKMTSGTAVVSYDTRLWIYSSVETLERAPTFIINDVSLPTWHKMNKTNSKLVTEQVRKLVRLKRKNVYQLYFPPKKLKLQRVTDTTHDEETVCACSKSGGKKLKLAKKRPKLFRSERGPTGYFVISGSWASLCISKYYPGSVDISHQCWVNFGVSKTRLHRWFIRCTKTGTKCHCETNSRDTHMAFIWTNQNAAAIHSQGNTYERVTIGCWGQMTQKMNQNSKLLFHWSNMAAVTSCFATNTESPVGVFCL